MVDGSRPRLDPVKTLGTGLRFEMWPFFDIYDDYSGSNAWILMKKNRHTLAAVMDEYNYTPSCIFAVFSITLFLFLCFCNTMANVIVSAFCCLVGFPMWAACW